jgi:hypothetical protein
MSKNNKSKRESRAWGRLMFSDGDLRMLYLPYAGLAAARTDVRALSVVVMPALAIDTVCCSITCTSVKACPCQHQFRVSQFRKRTSARARTCTHKHDVHQHVLHAILYLMDCCTIALLHLVKLVNAANSLISKHQSTALCIHTCILSASCALMCKLCDSRMFGTHACIISHMK